jgi:four helix bundle protein
MQNVEWGVSPTARLWQANPHMPHKHRDIQDRAFRFACDVVRFCDDTSHMSPSSRLMAAQLTRAATSLGSNLEEASAGQSKPDFISKVSIALKEARESLYWLRVIAAVREPLRTRTTPLISEADQLVAILTTILKLARSRPTRG